MLWMLLILEGLVRECGRIRARACYVHIGALVDGLCYSIVSNLMRLDVFKLVGTPIEIDTNLMRQSQ